MHKKWQIIGLIILSSFTGGLMTSYLLGSRPAYAQFPQPTRWEYQRIVHNTYTESATQFHRECEKVSQENWELIQVNEGTGYSNKIVTYWRRPETISAY